MADCGCGGVDDIEDLLKMKKKDEDLPRKREWEQAGVKTRIKKKKCCSGNGCDDNEKEGCCSTSGGAEGEKNGCCTKKGGVEHDDESEFNPNIPGTQNIFIKTFGCSHNVSDSEYMMGQLVEYGYGIVSKPDDADLILVNSCTVKNPSQDAFLT
jgi:hypothetical protein